jgi:hypothetical protein
MERSLRWAVIAAGVLGGLGCAASDDGGEPTGRRSGSARPGPAGAAGMAAPAAPLNPGGSFGNTDATPPPAAAPTGAAGDGCVVGQFCAPTNPDPSDCGSLTLEAEVEVIERPGNVLLVFDRSGSMAQQWNGEPRWEAAGAAIENALMPLASIVTVGSVFFPSADPNAPPTCVDPTGIACVFVPWLVVPGGTCGVNPISAADQINFVTGPDFLSAFSGAANTAPLYAPVPGGLTPLKEGLQQAQTALASGTLTGLTSVVVITDGDPNCEWDAGTSRQIVSDWQAAGISTHVIGLPGLSGEGEAVLNDLAAAGGTGMYITPSDSAALEQKLRQIAMETVQSGFESCEITINPPAEVPDKLHLVVTENGVDLDVARDLSVDASWSITADGGLVTLEGRLCDDATAGRFQRLRFEFGCVELPPLEPPPPVE